MNPLQMWKLYRKANKVLSLFQQATASYDKEGSMSKSLFSSKAFWFNLLTGGAELAQVLTDTRLVPTAYMAVAVAVINIGLRMVTDRPVHVLPK